jgi:hypothetical protein
MSDILAVIVAAPELSLLELDDPDYQLLEFALLGLAPLDIDDQPQPQPQEPQTLVPDQQIYGFPGSGSSGGDGGINWGEILRSIPKLTQEQADYAADILCELDRRGGILGPTENEIAEQVKCETKRQLRELLARAKIEDAQEKSEPRKDSGVPSVSISEGFALGLKHAGLYGAMGGMLLADSLSDIVKVSQSDEDRKTTIITGTNALLGGTIGALLVARGYKKKNEE